MHREDIASLLMEYRASQNFVVKAEIFDNESVGQFYQGQKRGLEIALTILGVTDNELDTICQDEYHKVMEELKCRSPSAKQ